MGVYIKGMEMPTSCQECPFSDYEEGFCFASGVKHKNGEYEFTLCPGGIKGGRHDDCPLVPVPPHGRLIDADYVDRHLVRMQQAQTGQGSHGVRKSRAVLRDAPTIIPAEEGE